MASFDLQGSAGGATQGAMLGATFGPWGAGIGGVVGLLAGGFMGDDDGGRGSEDVRDPGYHGEHWGRELAFRQNRSCGTFAAPTGDERDSQIPARRAAIKALIGPAGEQRIRELAASVGLPPFCAKFGVFFGVGPIPAQVPYAAGWGKFALSPSLFQQAAQRIGVSEPTLLRWIVTGNSASAPTPTKPPPLLPSTRPPPSGPDLYGGFTRAAASPQPQLSQEELLFLLLLISVLHRQQQLSAPRPSGSFTPSTEVWV